MNQKAKDVGDALKYLGLSDNRDFVLMGPCWGGAVILQGLMDKSIEAPTIVTVDPMHRLWYPQWMLNYIAPILPIWFIVLIKPLLKWLRLRKMTEKVQRQRAEDFIKEAVMWKWKKAAFQARHFELFGNLSKIDEEVFVFNATNDLIHDKRDYPKITRELQNGRFIYLETDESNRERIMGILGREFTQVSSIEGIPSIFTEFEKKLLKHPNPVDFSIVTPVTLGFAIKELGGFEKLSENAKGELRRARDFQDRYYEIVVEAFFKMFYKDFTVTFEEDLLNKGSKRPDMRIDDVMYVE